MERDQTEAPAHWAEQPNRSDEELARGERVPASVTHDEMLRAIAELEAELADEAEAPDPESSGH